MRKTMLSSGQLGNNPNGGQLDGFAILNNPLDIKPAPNMDTMFIKVLFDQLSGLIYLYNEAECFMLRIYCTSTDITVYRWDGHQYKALEEKRHFFQIAKSICTKLGEIPGVGSSILSNFALDSPPSQRSNLIKPRPISTKKLESYSCIPNEAGPAVAGPDGEFLYNTEKKSLPLNAETIQYM